MVSMDKDKKKEMLVESLMSQLKETGVSVKKYQGYESKILFQLIGPASGKEEDTVCTESSECIFFDQTYSCRWLRENKCASKCKARMKTQRELGVNSGIIKYRATPEEIKIKSKILRGIRKAEAVEEEIRKRELAKQRSDRMKRLNEIMWGIKSILKENEKEQHEDEKINAADVAKTTKYSHLKRLI